MWTDRSSPTFLLVIAASIVVHVASLAAMPAAERVTVIAQRPTTVAFETVSPAPPPAPPPPPPPVEAIAAPERVAARTTTARTPRAPARKPAAPPPEIAAAQPAPEPETPVDFSGVTLSNDGGAWASPTGNGEPMTGPIAAAAPSTRRGPVRASPPRQPADRLVPIANLSRAPRAPDLDTALAANYPREARRAGLTGKAVVRARILADGNVGSIRIVSESAPGFGTACRQTLAGSRWQAPLDTNRRPVMTDVSYTCTFAVTR